MRIGTWNVRSLYRVGAIKSVVGELEKYKLDLVGVQEVRWEGEGYKTVDNDELHDPYSLPNIVRVIKSRRMRWAGHVARMGEGRGAHRVLVGRPEDKRPLGRPRRRWEDNIKMDVGEIGIDGAN
jgi:hypothetical protein